MIVSHAFSEKKTFLEKIISIDYILVAVILLIGIISWFAMYSTDGGQFGYYTNSHILKFSVFFILFCVTFPFNFNMLIIDYLKLLYYT